MHATGLFDLTGKTALITGSARGLGRVLACGLGEAGAALVLNDVDEEALEKTAAELRADGLATRTSRFDVTNENEVEASVAAIEQEAGPIDVLVNNAGINLREALPELDTETWRQVLEVNLTGPMCVSRALARRMIPRRRGKIINICSLLSEAARPTCAPYAVSKAGLKMLTRSLAVELGPHNIQVNGIGPGYFVTEMTQALRDDPEFDRWVLQRTPAERWGEPRELVGCAVFLASEASSFVNGQLIYVDGGWLAAL